MMYNSTNLGTIGRNDFIARHPCCQNLHARNEEHYCTEMQLTIIGKSDRLSHYNYAHHACAADGSELYNMDSSKL